MKLRYRVRALVVFIVFILGVTSIHLYSELNNQIDINKQIMVKMDLLQEEYSKNIEYSLDVHQSKDYLLDEYLITVDRKDNPIDEFMELHKISSYSTSALLSRDYIYMNLWKDELIHSYNVFSSMIHPYLREDVAQSLTRLLDYSDDQAELEIAKRSIELYLENPENFNDPFNYSAIDRASKAWVKADIFKENTYKIHQYIEENGGSVDYLFSSSELLSSSIGLFIDSKELSKHYDINKTNEGYYVSIIDSDGKVVNKVLSIDKPRVVILTHYKFLVELTSVERNKTIYTYDIVANELSDPYYNCLYNDLEYIVSVRNGTLLVTNIELDWLEDIVVERSWDSMDDLLNSIIDVDMLHGDIMKLTYVYGGRDIEITEYIKIKN